MGLVVNWQLAKKIVVNWYLAKKLVINWQIKSQKLTDILVTINYIEYDCWCFKSNKDFPNSEAISWHLPVTPHDLVKVFAVIWVTSDAKVPATSKRNLDLDLRDGFEWRWSK